MASPKVMQPRHGRVGALNPPACLQPFHFHPLARCCWHCLLPHLSPLGECECLDGVGHARLTWMSLELGTENVCEHLLTLSSNLFLLSSLRLTPVVTPHGVSLLGSISARFTVSQPRREQGHGLNVSLLAVWCWARNSFPVGHQVLCFSEWGTWPYLAGTWSRRKIVAPFPGGPFSFWSFGVHRNKSSNF